MFNEPIEYSNLPVVYPWYEPARSEDYSPPTREEVADSYLRQWYRLRVGDSHIALRPTDAEHNELWPEATEATEVSGEFAELFGRYVLTWWNLPGQDCSQQQRDEQTRILNQITSERGLEFHPIALFGDRSHWVEPGLVIDVTEDQALELASVLGQEVVVRLEAGAVTVIRFSGEAGNYTVVSKTPVAMGVHVMNQAPCPMSRGPETDLPVKRQGAPGTSRGHNVGAMWAEHTEVAHSLVRCAVHKEYVPLSLEPGRAIALYEISYASRFTPMRFQKNNPVS